jgi:hypothetical protein
MVQKYWRGPVHTRALQETREILHIETGWRLVIGVGVLAVALAYIWLSGEHETARSEIIVRLALTSVILFSFPFVYIFKLLTIPKKLHYELEQENEQLRAKRATLTTSGPYRFKVPRYQNQILWRMKVHNSGPAAADNVHVNLRHGNAEPKDATWAADYPYPIGRVNPTFEELKLNPNNDESYEIISGWKSEAGTFFTKFHSRNPDQIQIQPEERWEFLYEATSSNAQTISFILQIFIEDDEVKAIRVN